MSNEHFVEGNEQSSEVERNFKFPLQLGGVEVSASEEQDYEEVIVKSVN